MRKERGEEQRSRVRDGRREERSLVRQDRVSMRSREKRGGRSGRRNRESRFNRESRVFRKEREKRRWQRRSFSRPSGRRPKRRDSSRGEYQIRHDQRYARWVSSSFGRSEKSSRSAAGCRGYSRISTKCVKQTVIPLWRREMGSQRRHSSVVDGESESEGQGRSLFIDNLHREADVRAVRWLLRRVGDVERIHISKKRRSNNGLAFAIVRMLSPSQVKEAVGRLHGQTFMGHKIFARQAKYETPSSPEDRERQSTKYGGKNEHAVDGIVNSIQTSGSGKVEGGNGIEEDFNRTGPLGDTFIVVGGACNSVECGHVDGKGKGRSRIQIEICCRCQEKGLVREEVASGTEGGRAAPCPQEKRVPADDGVINQFNCAGNTTSGVQNNEMQYPFSNGVQNTVPGWVVLPFSMQGVVPYGWWGYWQDCGVGYTWPYWYPSGSSQPMYLTNSAKHTTNFLGELHGIPSQRKEGQSDRAPIAIRKPSLGRGSRPDPVEEDIVNKERRGMEDDALHFDSFASVEDIRPALRPHGGGTEAYLVRPEVDQAVQQNPMVEEDDELDEDGGDIRNLFEDPEFPPGFEPVEGLHKPEDDPDEAFVKEEARQTLLLGKKLGCSVPDEERTLANLEGILREQRASYRQRCQAAKEGSKEDSDRCSRNSSKDGSSKVVGSRLLGFSKFSRVRKAARRIKK